MTNKSPFVSVPNEVDCESPSMLPNVGSLENMEYLGQSVSHKIYWNKTSPTFGLLCGSSEEVESIISDTFQVDKLNSVARLFAESHLETEPGARLLVLHTGHHSVRKASPSFLETKHTTLLVSPRMVQSTSRDVNRHAPRPLRFSENDIHLRHVLALFTPPPEMHHESSSRILTTVQYVISQLSTEGPFDLQAFIQLIEQEKWDDEGATFIALRQTLLTELLALYEDDLDRTNVQSPLISLNKVVLDLTDPILCSTQLDGVLMDMALHVFLNPSVDQIERTMIVFSAADEYLHASSPLFHSLRSLASEDRHNLSILVMTSDIPSLVLPPNIFDAIDYVALAGPARSLVWLETIRKYWISIDLPESPPKVLSTRTLMIISPHSQLLERSPDGERWTNWRDGYMCVELDETLRVAPLKTIAEVVPEPSLAYPEESGNDMSILRTSYVAPNQRNDSIENWAQSNTTKRVGVVGTFTSTPLARSTMETAVEIPNSTTQIADIGLDRSPQPSPLPSSNRGSPFRQRNAAIAQDGGSESDGSSRGEGFSEAGIYPISSVGEFVDNGTLWRPDLLSLFRISSDLHPEAYIKAPVEAGMYPDAFRLLVTTVLRLSGGYSNVEVAQKEIESIIRPFMTTMKTRGSPLPFKNCNKMIGNAWGSHIVRYSAKGSQVYVFLVNTQDAINELNLRAANGIQSASMNPITRTVSPYLPLVHSIARLAGNRASTPVPLKLVRKQLGGQVVVRSLGFSKFAQCVRDACSLGLVTKDGTGKHSTVSLRADWDHLQSLLVLRSAGTEYA